MRYYHLEKYKKGELKPETIEMILRTYDNQFDKESCCHHCKHCELERATDGEFFSCQCDSANFLTEDGCYSYEEYK